jgi:osmoprotectant transport system ATP-binding protein
VEGTAAAITLRGVGKRYPDGTVAVDSLDLEIPQGQLSVLIGPSGCGKSTILRMLNRLIEPTSGQILLEGEDIARADPVKLRRRIGYVIQETGLFPHQTVATNVATVPALLGWRKAAREERVGSLLELVGLPPKQFARRYPHELSGGQRQRVGVARALAADPVVLLMDEPFSAVDPIVRVRLQDEFLRLQEAVRKTIVMVTHDLDEAVRLGDRIAVLSQGGKLEQYAPAAQLLSAPANDFVADFVGRDRGIKRLAVTRIAKEALEPLDGNESGPSMGLGATLREALAALLVDGAGQVVVRDEAGIAVGRLTPASIAAAAAERPVD